MDIQQGPAAIDVECERVVTGLTRSSDSADRTRDANGAALRADTAKQVAGVPDSLRTPAPNRGYRTWSKGFEGTSRPVSRILCPEGRRSSICDGCCQPPPPLPACDLPGHLARAALERCPRTPVRRPTSFLALLRVGFALPSQSPGTRWSLTPPFHPYPLTWAVCFLWHCPAGRPGWVLPTTLLCGVRTFLSLRRDRPAGSSASRVAVSGETPEPAAPDPADADDAAAPRTRTALPQPRARSPHASRPRPGRRRARTRSDASATALVRRPER